MAPDQEKVVQMKTMLASTKKGVKIQTKSDNTSYRYRQAEIIAERNAEWNKSGTNKDFRKSMNSLFKSMINFNKII